MDESLYKRNLVQHRQSGRTTPCFDYQIVLQFPIVVKQMCLSMKRIQMAKS